MGSCSKLAVGMGGVCAVVLGRTDIKFITLPARAGGVCLQPDMWYRQSDENTCFCFTGAFLYLNWVIAKENVGLRRRLKVEGWAEEKKKKNGSFAKPCSKRFKQLNHRTN